MFQWRRFQFFEKEFLAEDGKGDAKEDKAAPRKARGGRDRDDDDGGRGAPLAVFREFPATCVAAGRGCLVLGDDRGHIRIVNRDYDKQDFQGFEGKVIALHGLKRSNTLVGIGIDGAAGATVKIWKLDKEDMNGNPLTVSVLRVFNPKFPPVPVTCFSVLEDLTQLAVGLGNGAVMLLDGNLLKERTVKHMLLQPFGPMKCVTGMHFKEDTPKVCLWVVSNEEVASFFTKSKSPTTKLVLDSEGGSNMLNCSAVTDDKKLVVARDQAVYFYEPEEKSVCYGFEGKKKMITWFGNSLAICEGIETIGDISQHPDSPRLKDTLTIYDLKNKLIAFEGKFDPLQFLVHEWGSIFVFTTTNKVYQLQEKDLPTKMEMLFKKNLYGIAISLANSQDCDKSFVMEIFQMYGDHLYSKGDYDGAIDQYLQTIKYIEPSYVIRKFLDAQRIHNLTRYLEALHEKGRANTDHTTLLLNCYTKLKDVRKLEDFIRTDAGTKFDVQTAIKVCRQASYFEPALYLAHKHKQHELFLKIQLEDEQNYREALSYIASLDFLDAERFAREFGKKLLGQLPEETCQLLIDLCTRYRPTPYEFKDAAARERDAKAKQDGGSAISSAASTVESKRSTASSSPASTVTTPVGSLPDRSSHMSASRDKAEPLLVMGGLPPLMQGKGVASVKSKPEDFIHFFTEQPQQLLRFLEHCLATDPKCPPVIYNTLLELYLKLDAEDAKEAKESKERGSRPQQQKISSLLKTQRGKYDDDHALMLCKMYGFEKGVLYLYGELRLFQEILQHHMERAAHRKILDTCRKYGEQEKGLWTQALTYFAGKKEPCEEEIATILEHVERYNLLPPLMVVKILSQNPTKPFAVVKDYIIKALTHEIKLVADDQQEIQDYVKDTQAMREEIEQLRTQPMTFQGVNCAGCKGQLSLPAVHFLCMHSYCPRCISDNDKECVKCAPEFRKVREIKDSMRASSHQHDRFYKHLDDSEDGFAAVAEYFGRGIFDAPPAPPPKSKRMDDGYGARRKL